MNKFAKFDEILSMILKDIKETKRYGHTVGRSDGLSDNVKTLYPPTNTVCRGYNKYPQSMFLAKMRKTSQFSSENFHFHSREKLQYITQACYRNVLFLFVFFRGCMICPET